MSRAGEIWEREGTRRRPSCWYLCLGAIDGEFGYPAYLLLSLDGPYDSLEGVLIERAKYCLDDPLPSSPALQRWRRVA